MKQNYFLGEISIGFLLFFAKMSKSIYNSTTNFVEHLAYQLLTYS